MQELYFVAVKCGSDKLLLTRENFTKLQYRIWGRATIIVQNYIDKFLLPKYLVIRDIYM